ncbi:MULTISPECIES: hypothetical protein [unclassified Butyrivibrio]|uniref:hypothetical protein n=1 Tax=unclassified Butyrivibrio TaxID=2639466 RepID=UPI00042752B1|nr:MULTISPECIES: hypothetical protein [unclassified Butyrivibrio]
MATDKKKRDPLPDIPAHPEEATKEKKLRAAPDEIIAKAVHEMMMKDHPEE